MTTTVTKDQLEALSSNDNGQAVSETKKYTGEFEGKFIGTLVGNATTAKQLEQPYNFSLAGDAEGTVAVNASSVVLNTTVNHATEADTADFAGKTNLAARATLADMANTAEFAYRAGRLSNLLIKLHGGVTGSGQLTNADTMDIAISGVDVSYFFVFSALPEKNPDITKAYVDLSGHHFWIYDTANTVWKDAYDYLLKTLELHGQRLDVLEQSKTTNTADIETLKSTVSQHGAKLTNHEDRITVNERGISAHDARITTNATDISALDRRLTAAEQLNTSQSESLTDHEKRIGNIETTSDVGQIAVRVQAIEDKNVEQDTALDNETKARIAKDTELESTINNLPNKYVTLDTRQNIPKKKTFTEPIESISIKDASFDVSTVPSTTVQHSFSFYDKNDKQIVVLQAEHNTNDEHIARLSAVAQNSENKKVFAQVSLSVKKDGTAIAIAPAPDDNSNGRNIATTAWVNTKISNAKNALDTSIDANANSITGINSQITTIKNNITNLTGSVNTINSNYVTLATDQYISGRKVFNKEIILKQSSVIGTNDWGDNSLVFVDKNNQRYGYIQPRYDNGVNSLNILAVLPTDPTQVKGISVRSDGLLLAYGKQIKETVIESVRNGTNWYRVWSDGWIEQGGYVTYIAGAGSTRINFFRAFQTTDYNISAGVIAASGIGHAARICVPGRGVNYMDIDWSDGNYTDGCYWRVEGY